MDNGEREPSDLIQSVSRAFRILEEVGAAPEGLNVKQIARRSRLSVATTYHLVRTLRYEGYLIRRDSGSHVLGPEIAARFRDLMTTFRPQRRHEVLSDLGDPAGHTPSFSQLVDERIVIADPMKRPISLHDRSPHPGG